MAGDELVVFRERWKEELTSNTDEQRPVGAAAPPPRDGQRDARKRYFENLDNLNEACSPSKGGGGGGGGGEEEEEEEEEEGDQPAYVSIARSLLAGRTSPLRDRMQEERARRKRQYHNMTCARSTALRTQQPEREVKKEEELLDRLIQDLDEASGVPFFDVELPYELSLKIFRSLDRRALGRCAQVSRAWRVLAEDGVLWFRRCRAEGYHQGAGVADSPCWKSALRDARNSARTVRSNWKNRVGSISQLQHDIGKLLCDVSCCDNFVLAGYTSGAVRLWDTLHWDAAASHLKVNQLSASASPPPPVSQVQVNGPVAAAAYEDGCVDLWSTETGGEPIHHYQIPGGVRVQVLALSPDGPALASAAGPDVRLVGADDHGYWRTLCRARLPDAVQSLVMVPGRGRRCPLAAMAAGDAVHLLAPREEEGGEGPQPRPLHSVYGHPVTCLDADAAHVAFGVKRAGGAAHDGGNQIHVYSLETGRPSACVGDSLGDFTCVNLRDGPPHLLVCGNRDRRVRVFDLRAGCSVASLYAHQLGVTALQADGWKVVSGGAEGLACVWETRTGAKLWEMHNRHPVRRLHFNSSTLVTANIPDDKAPRGACITDDDLTAHRRHRGVICHYDFSEDASPQDRVLPICRSDYVPSSGYNYNIGLAVPYDKLTGSHPPR